MIQAGRVNFCQQAFSDGLFWCFVFRHFRAGGNWGLPVRKLAEKKSFPNSTSWIPACAGMTGFNQ